MQVAPEGFDDCYEIHVESRHGYGTVAELAKHYIQEEGCVRILASGNVIWKALDAATKVTWMVPDVRKTITWHVPNTDNGQSPLSVTVMLALCPQATVAEDVSEILTPIKRRRITSD